ncbi:hypothetical protein KQI52_10355 [bacterium]|nr:hypothetical protein [bacterium]
MERPHILRQGFKLPDGTYLVQGVIPGTTGFTCQVGVNGETLWINYLEDNQQYSVVWNNPTYLLPDGTFLGRISNPDLVPGLEDLVWFNKDGDILRAVSFTGGYDPQDIEAVLPDGGILMSRGERLDAAGNLLYDMDYQAFADAIEDSLSSTVSWVLFQDVEPTDDFRYYAVGYMYRYAEPPEEQLDAWLACAGPGPEPIRLSVRKRAPEGTVDPGSPMRLRARVYSRGDVTQTVDIWTVARTPDWEVVGPIRMWSDIAIEPGEELAATLTQWVPEFAPAGDYNYILRVGDYPEHHYEAYFPFEVAEGQREVDPRLQASTGLSNSDTVGPRPQADTATSVTADRRPQTAAGWEMLIELIERYPATDDEWFAR